MQILNALLVALLIASCGSSKTSDPEPESNSKQVKNSETPSPIDGKGAKGAALWLKIYEGTTTASTVYLDQLSRPIFVLLAGITKGHGDVQACEAIEDELDIYDRIDLSYIKDKVFPTQIRLHKTKAELSKIYPTDEEKICLIGRICESKSDAKDTICDDYDKNVTYSQNASNETYQFVNLSQLDAKESSAGFLVKVRGANCPEGRPLVCK